MTEEKYYWVCNGGDWHIRFGISQFLVCQGPQSTIELGKIIFNQLETDALKTWMTSPEPPKGE